GDGGGGGGERGGGDTRRGAEPSGQPAASDASETIREAKSTATHVSTARVAGPGTSTKIVPAPVATPFPPRNPRKIGRRGPRNASAAAPTRSPPGGPRAGPAPGSISRASGTTTATGTTPLRKSRAKTSAP